MAWSDWNFLLETEFWPNNHCNGSEIIRILLICALFNHKRLKLAMTLGILLAIIAGVIVEIVETFLCNFDFIFWCETPGDSKIGDLVIQNNFGIAIGALLLNKFRDEIPVFLKLKDKIEIGFRIGFIALIYILFKISIVFKISTFGYLIPYGAIVYIVIALFIFSAFWIFDVLTAKANNISTNDVNGFWSHFIVIFSGGAALALIATILNSYTFAFLVPYEILVVLYLVYINI